MLFYTGEFVIFTGCIFFGLSKPLDVPAPLLIVNGTNAAPGEFPFMCAVYYQESFTCGCTIISEVYILSAAHCVYDRDKTEFTVLTGTNDLMDPNGTETYVSDIIMHENYQYTANQVFDIALLKLEFALEFGTMTQPATLAQPKNDPPANSSVIVLGWGVSKYRGDPMQYLQKATVNTYENSVCKAIYQPYGVNILPTNMCAGKAEGGIGQCTGDSGGPVVTQGTPVFQVGIVSFSAKPCGTKGVPGVSTRVSQFSAWIKQKTGLGTSS